MGERMAIKLLFIGIFAGMMATASILALGGGVGLAVLGYIGGGFAGMAFGLASVLLPKDPETLLGSHDQPLPIRKVGRPT